MNIAFIPVRGGSKSIPLKNIKKIAGKPLVYWVLKAAESCDEIDKIYVSTDSVQIRKQVNEFEFNKVITIERSAESASDIASTEFAMLEFAEKYDFDTIALIQATSPLLTAEDLAGGFALFKQKGVDSVLSVVKQKRFQWEFDKQGMVHATNYNIFDRPRRQDFDGYYVENGAFYLTSKEQLLTTKNRVSGNIKAYEMDESTFFEIDETCDWIIVENLLKKRLSLSQCNTLNIKLVATDCDGVLTDGGMYYTAKGDIMKKFNALDGMGFEILRNHNIKSAIITGENHSLVQMRGEKLKVDDIIVGQKDKKAALLTLCQKYDLDINNIAYIGDDIFDIPAIECCGLGCAPNDSLEIVKSSAKFVTARNGGKGCFREFVEQICGT